MPRHPNLGATLAAAALLLTGCGTDADPTPQPPITIGSPGGSTSAQPPTPAPGSPTPGSPAPVSPLPSGPGATPSAGAFGPGIDLAATPFFKSATAIINLVADATQGAQVHELELEHSLFHGRWVYKVVAHSGGAEYELELDAATGEVLKREEGSRDDDGVAAVDPARLNPADAMRIAKLALPGTVSGWRLEWDNGRQRYEVTIRTGQGEEEQIYVDVESKTAAQDS